MESIRESVKIEKPVMDRIRAHVKDAMPKITVAYFLSTEMAKVMDRVEKQKSKKSSLN